MKNIQLQLDNLLVKKGETVQFSSKGGCIKWLNDVDMSGQGSKKDLKNWISKFRPYPKLIDKLTVRGKCLSKKLFLVRIFLYLN